MDDKLALNTVEIMEILPHRHPFLLVDRIEEMVPGQYAIGRKSVTFSESFFQGHFPGNPVMPGVLILEAMAQTGAVAILYQEDLRGKTAYFAGMDKVRFKKKVLPGDLLTMKVELVKFKGSIGMASGQAFVGEDLAASCEMTFAIG